MSDTPLPTTPPPLPLPPDPLLRPFPPFHTPHPSSDQLPYWRWYCDERSSTAATWLAHFITGFLPLLLLCLWQGMILPLLLYIGVQVRAFDASPRC
jgi:hypothetical protein